MSSLQTIPANLPAHLASLASLLPANDLSNGVSGGFPVLSIKGSKWRMKEGGEEKPIYMPGTRDLAPAIRVVLLKANPNVAKTFYGAGYQEGSDAPPDCHSEDGITPDPDSPKPQCSNCAQCPNNAWGSKITPSGSKTKACADQRRVAVLPSEDLEHTPILLRVPAASLNDLAQYGKNLNRVGRPYAGVVTKMSFDADAAFPKIVFEFDRDLDANEVGTVVKQLANPVVEDVIAGAVDVDIPAQEAAPGAAQAPAPAPAAPSRRRRSAAAAPVAESAPPAQQAQAPAEQPAASAASNVVHLQPQQTQVAAQQAPAVQADTSVPASGNIASDIESALAGLSL